MTTWTGLDDAFAILEHQAGALAFVPVPPTPIAASPHGAAFLDGGCAPPGPRIGELAARIHGISGREGYYARETLDCALRDRNELVRRLEDRGRAFLECMPAGAERDSRLDALGGAVEALKAGRDPADWDLAIYVVDVSAVRAHTPRTNYDSGS